jgi:hypothetical protein
LALWLPFAVNIQMLFDNKNDNGNGTKALLVSGLPRATVPLGSTLAMTDKTTTDGNDKMVNGIEGFCAFSQNDISFWIAMRTKSAHANDD